MSADVMSCLVSRITNILLAIGVQRVHAAVTDPLKKALFKNNLKVALATEIAENHSVEQACFLAFGEKLPIINQFDALKQTAKQRRVSQVRRLADLVAEKKDEDSRMAVTVSGDLANAAKRKRPAPKASPTSSGSVAVLEYQIASLPTACQDTCLHIFL